MDDLLSPRRGRNWAAQHVATLDKLLEVGRQDPGDPHLSIPVFELVPVVVFHVFDAPLNLTGPGLGPVAFDPSGEDEPFATADYDMHLADRHLIQLGGVVSAQGVLDEGLHGREHATQDVHVDVGPEPARFVLDEKSVPVVEQEEILDDRLLRL